MRLKIKQSYRATNLSGRPRPLKFVGFKAAPDCFIGAMNVLPRLYSATGSGKVHQVVVTLMFLTSRIKYRALATAIAVFHSRNRSNYFYYTIKFSNAEPGFKKEYSLITSIIHKHHNSRIFPSHFFPILRANMVVKKIFRIGVTALASMVIFLLVFLAISIAPLDRIPVQQKPAYVRMMSRLDSLQKKNFPSPNQFTTGFAKENLTPAKPISLAGYGNRKGKLYTAVHDSIYVRAIVVDNGVSKVAIVTADLLIIPPTVTALLEKQLPSIGFTINNTYLGATHTHNSIGNWGEGVTGILYGGYEDSVVHFIADKIIRCIQHASKNRLPSVLKAGHVAVGNVVENRITDNGGIDSLLRIVEVHRSDSSKLLLMSFTAHATCLFSKDLELSRDYPGKLVDEMEATGYTFAMYMAGAVGSHGYIAPESGRPCVDWMTMKLKDKITKSKNHLSILTDTTVAMYRVRLELPPPNAKVLKDWRLRPWFFRAAFAEYPVYLTALQVGDLIMLGTPCDFSGELSPTLDTLATHLDKQIMITSFNGGYIGYITADQYYDRDHYETRLMNWYGPGTGDYLTECLTKLTRAIH